MKNIIIILCLILLTFLSAVIITIICIPKTINAFETLIMKNQLFIEYKQIGVAKDYVFHSSTKYEARLFGLFTIKEVIIQVFTSKELYLGGNVFGMGLVIEGMLIGEIELNTPAYKAGMEVSDILLKINGTSVDNPDVLQEVMLNNGEKVITLSILRNNKPKIIRITPEYSKEEKRYKLGFSVKETSAGIGTMIFYDEELNIFGGLGHGLYNSNSSTLLPIKKGHISSINITEITKSTNTELGHLNGAVKDISGYITANEIYGIFGSLRDKQNLNVKLPYALRNEVKKGRATLYCTIDNKGVKGYEVEIVNIDRNSTNHRNFLIRVIDADLIVKTGGIIQGLSGAPIVQNGKIVGCLSRVMLEGDKNKGYCLFMDTLLSSVKEEKR